MEREYLEQEALTRAKKNLEDLKGFYIHVSWYVAINTFIWVSIYLNLDYQETFFQFGHFIMALIWGVGIVIHGFFIVGFGADWEQRKIQAYLKKDINYKNI